MHNLTIALWAQARALIAAVRADDAGFSTAELLANAALGVAALVVIWAALSGVGEGVINQISSALGL